MLKASVEEVDIVVMWVLEATSSFVCFADKDVMLRSERRQEIGLGTRHLHLRSQLQFGRRETSLII